MIQPLNSFSLKEGVDIWDLTFCHPNLLLLFSAFCIKAKAKKLPVRITSIMDEAKGRVSKSHAEGRAIDISSRAWPKNSIDEIVKELNNEYRHIAAISKKNLIPLAVVFHEVIQEGKSLGEHFHLQVKP